MRAGAVAALSLFFFLVPALVGAPQSPSQQPPAQQPVAQQPAPPQPPMGPREPRPNVMPKTPLPQAVLDLLANEISGQIIYNNEVKLAGAPWLRDEREFKDGFYESETIAALARSYGVTDVRVDRFPREATFDYPVAGEFWTITPEKRLVARLEADPALVGSAPAELDLTAGLVYVPPLGAEEIKTWRAAGPQEKYKGKVALLWNFPRGDEAAALDAAGVAGVVSFSSQERYFDPNQVIFGRGATAGLKNLLFFFRVSWRQWSELLEDVEAGRTVSVRAVARIEKHPDRYENVLCVIPGTEAGAKGVIFSAHLFEGYIKRGANDNMSGCVVQLEILRALTRLIREGALPAPRRTIAFLWPQEISGTYEQIKRTEGFAGRFAVNINMDMVGEGLRKNNAVMTMSECPNYLPSFLDGLTDSVLNYVWRTNDIVYTNDSPRGRPGGQYLPKPLWEKGGSLDAFRYFVHEATGGSDHVVFNNASVRVPGIELFTWPDQWYHSDADTPDKSDPTQMRRVAFIGASAAWAAANCDDTVLAGLLESVSDFGYGRVGKRELGRALQIVTDAEGKDLEKAMNRAVNLAGFAAAREKGAVESVRDVYTGSEKARAAVAAHVRQWELYGASLERQVKDYAAFRAAALKVKAPAVRPLTPEEKKAGASVPSLSPDVKAKEFTLEQSERYRNYTKDHPDAVKGLRLSPPLRRTVLNYIDGRRTLTVIRRSVEAEAGTEIDFKDLSAYIDFLRAVGWIR
ncbi:MAG TPA: M28 family peptidase [Acidobacteriota bacterium]|nr:M28 family peptidase [Acidobacteriota bacterium]